MHSLLLLQPCLLGAYNPAAQTTGSKFARSQALWFGDEPVQKVEGTETTQHSPSFQFPFLGRTCWDFRFFSNTLSQELAAGDGALGMKGSPWTST